METIATLAVMVLYCMANLALTSYIRREHRAKFSVWQHGVFPWIALALLPVVFITICPFRSWAVYHNSLLGFWPYGWRESRNPGAPRRGATKPVGSRSTKEGEVDWDQPIAPL